MIFFTGLHQPSDAKHFDRAFVSVNRLRTRKRHLGAKQWIMDSGAFTEISTYGRYRNSVADYAALINRWSADPGLVAAVSQDFMCESFILEKTGLAVEDHQRLTIERFDALAPLVGNTYLMPVLQGYTAGDYIRHLESYGARLAAGAWVGIGSICKRNTSPVSILRILAGINHCRPDLRLHGFGLKITALASASIRDLLHSADSMAWSFAARKQGRNANDWREAAAFTAAISSQPSQLEWLF